MRKTIDGEPVSLAFYDLWIILEDDKSPPVEGSLLEKLKGYSVDVKDVNRSMLREIDLYHSPKLYDLVVAELAGVGSAINVRVSYSPFQANRETEELLKARFIKPEDNRRLVIRGLPRAIRQRLEALLPMVERRDDAEGNMGQRKFAHAL